MRNGVYSFVLSIATLALAGCGGLHSTDLTAAGRVKGANTSSKVIDVASPTVVAEGNNLVVSGTVTRRAGFNGPVPGRLDITVVSADGSTVLQEFSTGWDPPHIPVDGDRRANYVVRYGWLPPDGVTVRVEHVPNDDDPPDGVNGASAIYRPRYRGTDRRQQLLDGLGGDRSWSYHVMQQRAPDVRAK